MENLTKRLNNIQRDIRENVAKYQTGMVTRANSGSNTNSLEEGDYVYRLHDQAGPGKKLHDKYDGPYVVHEICSDHTLRTRDPETGRPLDSICHIDRLKIAYVREPNPVPYFLDREWLLDKRKNFVRLLPKLSCQICLWTLRQTLPNFHQRRSFVLHQVLPVDQFVLGGSH